MIKKFRKKPIVIEAVQWDADEDTWQIISHWSDITSVRWDLNDNFLIIYTLEGAILANIGDWVIKGIRGELYPCKPDIFEATYELYDR